SRATLPGRARTAATCRLAARWDVVAERKEGPAASHSPFHPDAVNRAQRVAMVIGLFVALWAAGIALLPFHVSQGVAHVDCRSPIHSAFEPTERVLVAGTTGHEPRAVAPVLIVPS